MTIAIYAGSFNPLHKGHIDILLKSKAIFDKVIIARGVNPDKPKSEFEIPKQVNDIASVMEFTGLLTDFIKSIELIFPNDKVVLVRGLRNSTDFEFELTQYRYIEQLMPEIKMVSLICDKQYDHVSSSGIRALSKFGEENTKDYLI
jgi:pantetheine-phosphate adenylyltransferase